MNDNPAGNIELGDWISIYSLDEPVTGDVIYRNDKIIRVKPKQARTLAKDYLLDENGDFQEQFGVYLVQVHTKSEYYHYAAMLGVKPGDIIELYTKDGELINEFEDKSLIDEEENSNATVAEIITTDTDDALILTNGIRLSFGCVGPEPPVAIIVPAMPPPDEYAQVASEEGEEEKEVEPTLEELLRDILPSTIIEEIPTSERFYPDPVQRQDMYNDFISDLPPDKQKNRKALHQLSQKVEYLLALKQSTVKLNIANRPIGIQKSTFESLSDVTQEVRSSYIPACIPIYDVKRSLYLDVDVTSPYDNLSFEHLMKVEHLAHKKATLYEKDEYITDGIRFFNYLDQLFQTDIHPYGPISGSKREAITYEQEAFIAPNPGEDRKGFESNLPVGYLDPKLQAKVTFVPLTDEYLSVLSTSSGRFLPSVKAANDKNIPAGTLTQPADQVVTTGYVILDTPTILQTRTLTNVPSLLTRIQIADYQHSQAVKGLTGLDQISIMPIAEATADAGALLINKDQVENTTKEFWEIWIRNNLYRTLSPIHAFSPASNMLSILLDSFVPASGDFPQNLQNEIWRFIERNTDMWTRSLQQTRERVLKKLSAGDSGALGEPFSPIIESGIPLNERVIKDVLLSILTKNLKERETTLRNNPHVILNEFTKGFSGEAFIQYTIIMSLLENREPAFDPDFQKMKLENNIRAEQNRNVIAAALNDAFMSKPQYNSCAHTKLWSSVQRTKIRDRSRYIELFQEFLSRFQEEKKGNWIICNDCHKECCCVHEVMILNEVIHPGRALSLHKKVLMEFGGTVFEGHYICKNCGEPIQGIEFDTSIEFDDDGRPISGRGVIIEDEAKEIDITEIISKKTEIKFEKESEEKLYLLTKMISERAGASLTDEVYRRIVYRASSFLNLKIPTEAVYNEAVQKQKATGSRRKDTHYDEFVSNQQIGAIAVLFLFELQTCEPSIEIKQAFLPCKFSIAGYPLEGLNPEEAGSGALNYVACCTASIIRREKPWIMTSWFAESDTTKRTNAVKNFMVPAFSAMIGTTKSGVQLPISSEIRDIMKMRSINLQLMEKQERPSIRDKIPNSYAPEPFIHLPEGVSNSPLAEDPNPGIASMDITQLDKPKRDLEYRLNVIYSQLKDQSYTKAAQEGLVVNNSERSTSYASPTSLLDIKRGVLQVLGLVPLEEEAHRIARALRSIELRTPTNTNTGTHIWTNWEARPITVAKVEIPKNILFKLFLRNCYKGPAVGLPHKLGYGMKCKNCGFQFPASPDVINAETEGKNALDDQGIDYSEGEFDKILAEKREKQSIPLYEKMAEPELLRNISAWAATPIMGDNDVDMWNQAGTIMTSLSKSGKGSVPIARDSAWGDFVVAYDARRQELKARISDTAERRTRAEAIANDFLASLDVITSGAFTTAPDNITNAVVSPLLQRTSNYKVDSITALRSVKVRKGADVFSSDGKTTWMEFSSQHTEDLNAVMAEHTSMIRETTKQAKEVAKRIGLELGTWIQRWKELIFEDIGHGFTEKEGQYVLRNTLVRIFLEIVDTRSHFYKDLPVNEPTEKSTPELTTVMKDTIFFIGECITRFSSKSQIPDEKKLAEILLKRAESEKNFIINIFEKLDDEEMAVEKTLKKFGIGKWAMGKNVKDYSPELYEHDREQRIGMGMLEMPAAQEGGGTTRADLGFMSFMNESRADRGYNAGEEEGREYGENELRGGD